MSEKENEVAKNETSNPTEKAIPLVEEIEQSKPNKNKTELIRTHSHFQGPLPPPAILQKYENIHPGFANRIMRMAEKEQKFQHNILDKQMDNDHQLSSRGQNYALIIAMALCISAVGLAIKGLGLPAGLLGTGGIVAVIYIFITGHKIKRNKNNEAKQE